jgi:hypothetical protein
MKLAQLMRHPWQRGSHRAPDRELTIRDHAAHRHRQPLLHLSQQGREVLLRGGEQGARQQHLAREQIPDHPQHLVPHIRLQPVESQYHRLVGGQALSQPRAIRETHRDQFLVAMQQKR